MPEFTHHLASLALKTKRLNREESHVVFFFLFMNFFYLNGGKSPGGGATVQVISELLPSRVFLQVVVASHKNLIALKIFLFFPIY